jgi:predicted ATPase
MINAAIRPTPHTRVSHLWKFDMITSVKLSNFLSFGNNASEIDLLPVNVIIGANGSGKSNFLEAFDLLRNAPADITKPIREGGGVSDWLYKGNTDTPDAYLGFTFDNLAPESIYMSLQYSIAFSAANQEFVISDEKIVNAKLHPGKTIRHIFYDFNHGRPILNIQDTNTSEPKMRTLQREEIDPSQSILAQKRDTIHYPEITSLAREFSKIRLYREWSFGLHMPARLPQKADMPNHYLEPDGSNLSLVLNQIRNHPIAKKRLLKELRYFYNDVDDYEINIMGNTVQIFFHECGLRYPVPATRLSDGTLRYLCLLAILCNPTPSPLVCIEEPELGLHPDILPKLSDLLRETSERCQLVVTTHSPAFVDTFSENPEVVLVAEKTDEGTQLNRLGKKQLKCWLETYQLGELWTRGDIGGNRW